MKTQIRLKHYGLVLWIVATAIPLSIPQVAIAADMSKAKSKKKSTPKGDIIDEIAAVVGSEIILLSEVKDEAELLLAQTAKAGQPGQELMQEQRKKRAIKDALDQIINDRMVLQQAREMELSVSTDEVDRTVANMAKENGVDLETFHKALKAQGMELNAYRAQLRRQLLRFKVMNMKVRGRASVSESEARQYYNNQVRDVRTTGKFEGAHILLRVKKGASAAEVADVRKAANELKSKLDDGTNFAIAARDHSEDAVTAPYGGSLGMRDVGTIPKVLDAVFIDLEVGEIAGPIRSSAGFHIVRLNNRQALDVQSFNEVKQRIINQLVQEEMARQEKIWLKELRQKTFVEVRL